MDIQELKKIIAVFEKSELSELELEKQGEKIRLKKESTALIQTTYVDNPAIQIQPKQDSVTKPDSKTYLKAPLVGSVYLAPNPNAKPYVSIGQQVKAGDVVCLVEAMKVMNEIKAPEDAVILNILVENGAMVDFNQKLMEFGNLV